jgi:hypothetical protein
VATVSRFVVHDRKIDKFTLPSGKVWRYSRSISTEVAREAKATAPVRTGRLRESIKSDTRGSNRSGTNWRVSAKTPYVKYVVNFTAGKTMPGRKRMRLYGDNPMGWINTRYGYTAGRLVKHVDGYMGNPFLQDSLHVVLLRHGLI